NQVPALPVPAAAVDLSFPAPGLPLVLTREYGGAIDERYRVGRLGRGWGDLFDLSLEKDATTGVVTILSGDARRGFGTDKGSEGVYRGEPGEFATVTEAGGAFTLHEPNGELVVFRSDGLLDYLQDRSGNRITAGYTGTQLSSLKHSSGKALTLAYN